MIVRRGQVIVGQRAGAGTSIEGMLIEECEITGCRIDLPGDPRQRPRFTRLTLVNNVIDQMAVQGALIEDSTVDGVRMLSDRQLFVIAGCVFCHVTFRGTFHVTNVLGDLLDSAPNSTKEAYREANTSFYQNLIKAGDWALDISEVQGEVSIRGIPSQVIRRNPETQIVMTFEQALLGEWRTIQGVMESVIGVKIGMLLDNGWPDVILATGRHRTRFVDELKILRELQRAGVAQLD
ncbi:hypothetical protein [Spirillospora sp. NPDC048819]|uniref:hypothetical protein n=1 Tax=Spirillospora sp. NPDC048819 TaxID=3155268 RepID=UPI00340CBD13